MCKGKWSALSQFLLTQRLLAAVKQISGKYFIFQQDSAATRVVSLEISGGKFPEIYSSLSGNF